MYLVQNALRLLCFPDFVLRNSLFSSIIPSIVNSGTNENTLVIVFMLAALALIFGALSLSIE